MKEPEITFSVDENDGLVKIFVNEQFIVEWTSDDGDAEPLVDSFTTVFHAGMDYTDYSKGNVLNEVSTERTRQDEKWGGSIHDDKHHTVDFCRFIKNYTGWAEMMSMMDSPEKARKRLIQIAALASAAVESIDRKLVSKSLPKT